MKRMRRRCVGGVAMFCNKALGGQLAMPPIGPLAMFSRKLKAREDSRDHVVDLRASQGPVDLQHNS